MRRFGWVLCALLAAGPALAGTEITIETRKANAAPGAKPQRGVVEVEGRRLRAEAGDGRRGAIWRGEEGVLEILDHRKKSVFRIDRATARELAGARDGVREGIEGLPDAPREAIERWVGGEPPARVELRSSGKSAQVNGVACRLLDAFRNGVRLAEVCEGPRGAAGVTPEALAPARELAKFVAEVGDLLPRSMTGEGLDALVLVERVQGVPLRVRAWPKDAPATESRIVSAVPKPFAPERFQLPPGYEPSVGINVGERAAPP
jgi:hypothetical protein